MAESLAKEFSFARGLLVLRLQALAKVTGLPVPNWDRANAQCDLPFLDGLGEVLGQRVATLKAIERQLQARTPAES